jgi:hypothetical protein
MSNRETALKLGKVNSIKGVFLEVFKFVFSDKEQFVETMFYISYAGRQYMIAERGSSLHFFMK